MIRLLVSIRNREELQAVINAGVAIVDIKEPDSGALGAANKSVWQAVAKELKRQARQPATPLSVACGELRDWVARDDSRTEKQSWNGVDYAKVGLEGMVHQDWKGLWHAWMKSLPAHVSPVVVAYADWDLCQAPHPLDVVAHLGCERTKYFLLDTAIKTEGSILEIGNSNRVAKTKSAPKAIAGTNATQVQSELKPSKQGCSSAQPSGITEASAWLDTLSTWLRAGEAKKWKSVLGGSIKADSIPKACQLKPHMIAVRTAVCDGKRTGTVVENKVRQLKLALEQCGLANW